MMVEIQRKFIEFHNGFLFPSNVVDFNHVLIEVYHKFVYIHDEYVEIS